MKINKIISSDGVKVERFELEFLDRNDLEVLNRLLTLSIHDCCKCEQWNKGTRWLGQIREALGLEKY